MEDDAPLSFVDLPDAIVIRILGLLQPRDLCTLQQCAKRLFALCNDNHLWAMQLSDVYDLRFEVAFDMPTLVALLHTPTTADAP